MEKYFSFLGDLVGGMKKVFGGSRVASRAAAVICLAALGFAPGLRADLGEDDSSIGVLTSAKTWDTGEHNGYTFAGEDSINVENIAVNITAGEASKEFTLNFKNDPSVRTDIADPEVKNGYIQAHIYAHSADSDAVGISLADGVNLSIAAAAKEADVHYRPTIAAYKNGSDSGAAVVIRAPGASVGNEINVAVPLLLHASSSSSSSSPSRSAAALFGAASGDGTATVGGENTWTLGGDSNNLSATSSSSSNFSDPSSFSDYSYSAAALFGAASGGGTATVGGENIWFLRDSNSNNLSASSSSSSSSPSCSAAALFGAASGGSAATVDGTNSWTLENSNTLSATSTSYSSSAAIVFGAASGDVTATVNGTNTWTLGDRNILSASSSSSSNFSYFAAAIFGAVSGNGAATVGGENIWTLGNSNILSATSSPLSYPSTATVFGAASGGGSATVGGTNSWTLGNGNTLSATSTSSSDYSYSVAAVFGAVSGIASATVNGANSWTLGDSNILSATSTISTTTTFTYSTATLFGAASGDGSATVDGTNSWTLGNGNTLSATSLSLSPYSYSYSTATLFGAASGNGNATASGIAISANGSQTLSALAYCQDVANARVNAFGADNTDMRTYTAEGAAKAGDGAAEGDPIPGAFGWRVGIFATGENIVEGGQSGQKTIASAVETDSTVNILAAKLGKATSFGTSEAVITLGAKQGTSSADYARAFALGNDFKIYVGSRVDSSKDKTSAGDNYGFVSVAPNGKTNAVNIFGAISKGKDSSGVAGSSLTIDSGWTVNAYGPVEDLASIDVKSGTFNTYGNLKNITIAGGTVNAYGTSNGVGTLCLKNGVLNLARCGVDGNGARNALGQIAENLSITDPKTGITYGKSKKDGDESPKRTVTIGGAAKTTYLANFGTAGKLVLNEGDVLEFHYDSSQEALNISPAKGYITVENHGSPAIDLQGGTFKLVDDQGEKDIPEAAGILLVSCSDEEPHAAFSLGGRKFAFELVSPETVEGDGKKNMWDLASIDEQPSLYEIIDIATNLGLRYYGGTGLVFCSEDESPRIVKQAGSRPSELAQSHANGELATTTTASTLMVQDAIATRFTDVKGNGNDPFLLAVAGHTHQGEIGGFGYSSDLYGLTGGADYLCNLQGERYLRLGTALGYIRGDTEFNGAASGLKKTARQNMYSLALFGAYEAFDPQNLKTNVNFYTGLGYNSNRLFRVDANSHAFGAKLKSNSAFFSFEVTKNLCAWQGTQFGLWLKADYNHIKQKGYSETSPNGGTECSHVSKMNFNFLTTILGINVEKEIDHPSRPDRRLRLYAKAGWSCQAVREHSKGVAWIEGLQSGNFTPTLGFPSRHAAVFVAGFRNKLNAHWDIIGQWNAHFSKDQSSNIFSLGTGYSF
ncbi:MAG: autotransporter outer membrane beta-barrel domain-containing protein [Puniceicoccales bacterium]|jgi:hypothetical protein|nr:autotransporter outer membrane beta-barrel domain-containing protein [Puniceicoccales bacterium]